MKSLTLKDLREELKTAFKENNDFIFKYIKSNNNVLIGRIDTTIHKRLSEFSDVVLETIDINHNETNQKFNETNQKINDLSKDMKDVKQDIKFLHQDFKDLETELSNKPSRKQFEELKSRFDFA